MKNLKPIEAVFPPPPYHWVGNGFKVHNFLPRAILSNDRMSPFFLLDYNAKMHYPPSEEKRGVGVHPHRGLETVTIAYHGKIAHHDSTGNGGIISAGDVQWMTAGKAILHKEYHEESYVKAGGDFQMVQLWVNLPAKFKMTEPKYQEIPNAIMGKYLLDDNKGTVNVIVGKFHTATSPASTFTPINLFDIHLEEGSEITFQIEALHNTAILIIEGQVNLNGKSVTADHFVLFENKGTDIVLHAETKSVILLMSGEPIHEPVFPYGPFLMNAREEIEQAYEDYSEGLFGFLED
jgi:redox-sensitive bicupin YhaK (pirin superfamily)